MIHRNRTLSESRNKQPTTTACNLIWISNQSRNMFKNNMDTKADANESVNMANIFNHLELSYLNFRALIGPLKIYKSKDVYTM